MFAQYLCHGLTLPLPHSGAFAQSLGRVSTNPHNQILVEFVPTRSTGAKLFDLNAMSLVFTPDGQADAGPQSSRSSGRKTSATRSTRGRRSLWGSRTTLAAKPPDRSTSASTAR